MQLAITLQGVVTQTLLPTPTARAASRPRGRHDPLADQLGKRVLHRLHPALRPVCMTE